MEKNQLIKIGLAIGVILLVAGIILFVYTLFCLCTYRMTTSVAMIAIGILLIVMSRKRMKSK